MPDDESDKIPINRMPTTVYWATFERLLFIFKDRIRAGITIIAVRNSTYTVEQCLVSKRLVSTEMERFAKEWERRGFIEYMLILDLG